MLSNKTTSILFSLLLIVALAGNGVAQNVDQSALALKKSGEVFRKPAGFDTKDEQVKVGSWFNDFDSVRTASASFLAILFTDDKSLLKMRENTRLTIQGNTTPSQKIRQVRINIGSIKTKINPQINGKYEIISPVSVASVKGTEFWLTVDPSGIDTFIGLEGTAEIMNIESGQTLLLTEGMTITSSWTGTININPTDPATIPSDPDIEPQQGGQQQGGDSPQDVQPTPTDQTPVKQSPTQTPSRPQDSGGSKLPGGIGLSASVGAAVLDGQVYNQISLRPDIPIGPFRVGLDLNFYFDADGNLREEDWDEPLDAIDKIFYLRYNSPEDPFYIRAGGLTGVTMGQGLIMDNYSNTIEYPQVRRVGLTGHREFGKLKFQGLVANLRELKNPGLLGARVSYNVLGPLKIGATFVIDGDQYAGIPDRDEDGVPDAVDDFPDDSTRTTDTDGDGVADKDDPDRDGDGYTDQDLRNNPSELNDTSGVELKTVLSLKNITNASSIYGVDIEYPLFNNDLIGITAYGEFAKINSFNDTTAYGSGFALPGVRATIGPVYLKVEYRQYTKHFIGNFYDRTYDLGRARLIWDEVGDSTIAETREDILLKPVKSPLTGVFGGAALNMLDMFTFSAYFSRMKSTGADTLTFESLFGDVSINPVFIPKINKASLFYQQTNVESVFDFEKTPSTLLGWMVSYEIAPSVSLQIRSQQTYADRNGDGDVKDEGEAIKLTSIETVFTF